MNVDLVLLKSLTKINYSDVGLYIYISQEMINYLSF